MNIFAELIKNQLIRVPVARRYFQRFHVTGINQDEKAVREVTEFYLSYFDPHGKRVLELGPGQTWQIASQMKAAGATVAIADIDAYISSEKAEEIGVDYRIYDGKKLPFEDEQFDVILSHTVYEHIRFPEITITETYRLLKKGGKIVHLNDLGDHYSYGVNEDLLFNCLKYPEWLWRAMTLNRSGFVNRLRQSEWIALHEKTGFTITKSKLTFSKHIRKLYDAGKLSYLDKFSEEDRFCSQIVLCAVKD
jgi:ubiquinone/menaquinone biosynthesis C-methylase UbiE